MAPRLTRREFDARLRCAEEGVARYHAANDRLQLSMLQQGSGMASLESVGRLSMAGYGDDFTRVVEEVCQEMGEGIQMIREGPLSSPATTLKLVVRWISGCFFRCIWMDESPQIDPPSLRISPHTSQLASCLADYGMLLIQVGHQSPALPALLESISLLRSQPDRKDPRGPTRWRRRPRPSPPFWSSVAAMRRRRRRWRRRCRRSAGRG